MMELMAFRVVYFWRLQGQVRSSISSMQSTPRPFQSIYDGSDDNEYLMYVIFPHSRVERLILTGTIC